MQYAQVSMCCLADNSLDCSVYQSRWWPHRAVAACISFGLCQTETHGSRPSHQLMVREFPSYFWLHEEDMVSVFQARWCIFYKANSCGVCDLPLVRAHPWVHFALGDTIVSYCSLTTQFQRSYHNKMMILMSEVKKSTDGLIWNHQ